MTEFTPILLCLITKLQNLKAIHNISSYKCCRYLVVSNYKITKSESYSQQLPIRPLTFLVVSNYKITKSESYSQQLVNARHRSLGCV